MARTRSLREPVVLVGVDAIARYLEQMTGRPWSYRQANYAIETGKIPAHKQDRLITADPVAIRARLLGMVQPQPALIEAA
jgi:hypothetical protein